MVHERGITLVTGFSGFPGAGANPTEKLLGEIAPRWADEEAVRFHVFKTAYDIVQQDLQKLFAKTEVKTALHFGLSHSAQTFTFETLAHNHTAAARPDATGFCPPIRHISAEGPERLPSSLPLALMRQALAEQGIRSALSQDAGGYLCNYLFYLVRSGVGVRQVPQRVGFVHIPYAESQRSDNQKRGIRGGHYMADEVLKLGMQALIESALQ